MVCGVRSTPARTESCRIDSFVVVSDLVLVWLWLLEQPVYWLPSILSGLVQGLIVNTSLRPPVCYDDVLDDLVICSAKCQQTMLLKTSAITKTMIRFS